MVIEFNGENVGLGSHVRTVSLEQGCKDSLSNRKSSLRHKLHSILEKFTRLPGRRL